MGRVQPGEVVFRVYQLQLQLTQRFKGNGAGEAIPFLSETTDYSFLIDGTTGLRNPLQGFREVVWLFLYCECRWVFPFVARDFVFIWPTSMTSLDAAAHRRVDRRQRAMIQGRMKTHEYAPRCKSKVDCQPRFQCTRRREVVKVKVLVLHHPPPTLRKDVVQPTDATVHADRHGSRLQSPRERRGRVSHALIRIEDLGLAPAKSLLQHLQAEQTVQRLRQSLPQHVAAVPVHDHRQAHPAGRHGHEAGRHLVGTHNSAVEQLPLPLPNPPKMDAELARQLARHSTPRTAALAFKAASIRRRFAPIASSHNLDQAYQGLKPKSWSSFRGPLYASALLPSHKRNSYDL